MASTNLQFAEPISKRFPKSDIGAPQWVQLTGGASQVSASGDGSFWVLSPDGPNGGLNAADKYIFHNVNGAWTNVGGAAAHISAAQDGSLWVVNSLGGIYHNINNTWYALAGGAKDISVAPDGTIYVISKALGNAGIYHYDGANWTQLPGGGTTIAASPDSANHGIYVSGGFWVTNSFGEIYYFSPGVGYTQLIGKAAQIAPTKNGGIFVLGFPVISGGNPLYYNNLDTGTWTQIPGGAINLATDTNNVYAIGGSGGIYRASVALAPSPTPSPSATPNITFANNVYIAAESGSVRTYSGFGAASIPTLTSGLHQPISVAVDASGKFYVLDLAQNTLFTFNPDGLPTPPTITGLNNPFSVAVDANGKIYIANFSGGPMAGPYGGSITSYTATGVRTTPTITSGIGGPVSIVIDAAGKIYVSNHGDGRITTYLSDGSQTTPTIGGIALSSGLAVTSNGNIYVVEGNAGLRTFTPNGTEFTLAGGHIGTLQADNNVAVDVHGNIYVPGDNGTLSIYGPDGTFASRFAIAAGMVNIAVK